MEYHILLILDLMQMDDGEGVQSGRSNSSSVLLT